MLDLSPLWRDEDPIPGFQDRLFVGELPHATPHLLEPRAPDGIPVNEGREIGPPPQVKSACRADTALQWYSSRSGCPYRVTMWLLDDRPSPSDGSWWMKSNDLSSPRRTRKCPLLVVPRFGWDFSHQG